MAEAEQVVIELQGNVHHAVELDDVSEENMHENEGNCSIITSFDIY